MASARNTGQLKVTFHNNNRSATKVREYEYILVKANDPDQIVETLRGKIGYGETASHYVKDLEVGNYYLIGFKLVDPRPGNSRIHQLMVYTSQETVYDVNHIQHFEYLNRYA